SRYGGQPAGKTKFSARIPQPKGERPLEINTHQGNSTPTNRTSTATNHNSTATNDRSTATNDPPNATKSTPATANPNVFNECVDALGRKKITFAFGEEWTGSASS